MTNVFNNNYNVQVRNVASQVSEVIMSGEEIESSLITFHCGEDHYDLNMIPTDMSSEIDLTYKAIAKTRLEKHEGNDLNPLATPFILNSDNLDEQGTLKLSRVETNTNIKTVTGDYLMHIFIGFILILSGLIWSAMVANVTNRLGMGVDLNTESTNNLLREIRVKNVNRLIFGTLNINSLSSKFEQLIVVIDNHLDVLIIQETKLDPSFSIDQFIMKGYTKPYRLDRNRNGGGVVIYVREDIPSKELNKHNFTKNIEGLFVEINLRKTKLLLFGTYHSTHPEYGLNDCDYFEQVGLALDV